MRRSLPLSILLALFTTVSAQEPESALHRRVLRESAKSFTRAGNVYLVGASVFPFTVLEAYATRDSATRAATAAGRPYRAYGPFPASANRERWQVLSVTVRVKTERGEQTLEYNARTVDAIFLSQSAIQKFMGAYYGGIYGPHVADSLIQAIVVGAGEPGGDPKPPCHRGSFPCEPPDNVIWLPAGFDRPRLPLFGQPPR